MAKLILTLLAALLLCATPASADCGVNTIVTSDGRIISCTVCCLGGSCSTTCSR